MGCVSSKPDINDLHPNIFQVMNVNDMGHIISPGQLEVTETELVLYQRGKAPTKWPLRCLRKYGFDSEIFSFECGRRCPTGAGIYAFRCRKAEQLFNMLQQNIQLRNLNDDNPVGVNLSDFPVPLTSTGPLVHRRNPSQPESYLNPTSASSTVRTHTCLSRPGSITSNGPASPPATSPPPMSDLNLERNNNKRDSLILDHSYTNTSSLIQEPLMSPSYININPTSPTVGENYLNIPESNCHLYMNVTCENAYVVNTKDLPNIDKPQEVDVEDTKHCYANIDTAELENLRPLPGSIDFSPQSIPPTPTSLYAPLREVNYAELDLVPGKSNAPQQPPESPKKLKKSYVTIDFNKTNALSQSINPRMEVEEGSRKTRHNSTISDVPTRHSNSLSD